MLLSDRILYSFRPITTAVALGTSLVLAACTVQPLYHGDANGASQINVAPTIRTKLSGVVIDQPTDRFNQLVRNRLIFLLNGGAGEPSAPTYQLSLGTSYNVRTAVQMDIGDSTDRTGRASAGAVDGRATYILKNMENQPLVKRTRSVSASFDRPRQEYANLQAEENAKKRAAGELAEQIFLSLAQDMSKLK
ncbi:LPS assembly lipoprotein LptE [uncultured Bartonella sp.]|uniref:LPS assembly lipoprotein LptE n=1 Tax=uncultured Bartonella sp. TaxID=104108 RepID=UPI0026241DD1|nr:LPS assembly lipoprotein LptE [uncultured Bartonella sp.]